MKLIRIIPLIFSSLAVTASGGVTVSDSSLLWAPMIGDYDYLADQQTGTATGDIVGVGTNYGMFVTFDDLGTPDTGDGILGFRLRLDAPGGPTNKPAFDRVAWIGIDADINGSIDAFLGLNLQGSSSEIGVYAPGTGANTSPNTTSIAASPYKTYALTSANYNYRPVNHLTDGGTLNDVTTTTTGDPDYYVSFMVPFNDVAAFLNTKSIAINDTSPLRYVSATSTQTNSLNQDLGGVDGGVNSTTTWVDLGGFTNVVTVDGNLVPEPTTGLLALVAALGTCCVRRREPARR